MLLNIFWSRKKYIDIYNTLIFLYILCVSCFATYIYLHNKIYVYLIYLYLERDEERDKKNEGESSHLELKGQRCNH